MPIPWIQVTPRNWKVMVPAVALAGMLGYHAERRFNPVVELLAQGKPVFGLYIPSNPRAGRGGRGAAQAGTPAPTPAPVKSPAQLAQDAVGNTTTDFLFDGSTEPPERFDQSIATFGDFMTGMAATTPEQRRTHLLFVKTPIIIADTKLAGERIARQLNLGVGGIMFVGVESADEVKQGLAMMRFKSHGGLRPDAVGNAPGYWGLSEKEYKEKADVWPLNPNGELVNFTVVESKEGLAHVREIAAVKGIGVLFPGAGTLGGVFSTQDSTGRRVRDNVAWEASIQQVLSACKEFKVPCGYPANDTTMMEMRMKQGFSVFISSWGEGGFKAIDLGRKLGGRVQ